MTFTWVKQATGKEKHNDKDWFSPTVKGGCRYIYERVPGYGPNKPEILLQTSAPKLKSGLFMHILISS